MQMNIVSQRMTQLWLAITSTYINIFWLFLSEVLLRKSGIKWHFTFAILMFPCLPGGAEAYWCMSKWQQAIFVIYFKTQCTYEHTCIHTLIHFHKHTQPTNCPTWTIKQSTKKLEKAMRYFRKVQSSAKVTMLKSCKRVQEQRWGNHTKKNVGRSLMDYVTTQCISAAAVRMKKSTTIYMQRV